MHEVSAWVVLVQPPTGMAFLAYVLPVLARVPCAYPSCLHTAEAPLSLFQKPWPGEARTGTSTHSSYKGVRIKRADRGVVQAWQRASALGGGRQHPRLAQQRGMKPKAAPSIGTP